jgi:hypothetical protein
MTSPKDIQDLRASRNILAANIAMFHAGHGDLYRVVAVELRKLLCDGRNTLLVRMFPELELAPLQGALPAELRELFDGPGFAFHMSSLIRFDGRGGSRILEMFDESIPTIPLEEWLSQELFTSRITIKQLIRSIADKEAAHSDKEYNDTLKMTRSIRIIDKGVHEQHVVAIGEYLLKALAVHAATLEGSGGAGA